jgi:hypothetical protein
MSRARDDEMTFVLLCRDEDAPDTIRDWIARKIKRGKKPDDPKLVDAEQCARIMEAERPWLSAVLAEETKIARLLAPSFEAPMVGGTAVHQVEERLRMEERRAGRSEPIDIPTELLGRLKGEGALADPPPAPDFEVELETYRGHLRHWLATGEAGSYAAIRGREVAGIGANYGAALEAGRERFGDVPFLVRKIEAPEGAQAGMRDMGGCGG